jgi:hypothetical protein
MEAEIFSEREKQLWTAGYNQAIEDAARLCSKFDENNGEVLCVSYQLELKIKELKK